MGASIVLWALENTLVAGLLALLVLGAQRFLRPRPAVAHCLWLALLAVLLMPRLPGIATPGEHLRGGLRGWLVAPHEAPEALPEPSAPGVPADPLHVGLADPASLLSAQGVPSASAGARQERSPFQRVFTALASLRLATWLLVLWLAGAGVVLARSARRIAPFQRVVRAALPAPRALRREVREVAACLGLRAPEVLLVEGVGSPSVWCLGRPRLLWPAEGGPADTPRARRALIAHELAHLARRDHWVSWLEIPAAALAWWNPLFWWIRGRIRHFAELSCDAWAVWTYPTDRRPFAEALIDLQARTRTATVALQGLGATDSECKDFERRLDMIMQRRVFPGVSKGVAVVAALTAVLASPGFSNGDGSGKDEKSACCSVVESRAQGMRALHEAKERFAAKDMPGALAALERVVALDPENGWAHGRIGYIQVGSGALEEARASFARQYELGYERGTALYNTACAWALAGERERALEAVAAAVRHGFANEELMSSDQDLASIRDEPAYQEEIERVRRAAELREELAELEQGGQSELFLAAHAELCSILCADGKLWSEHGHMALKAGDSRSAAKAFAHQAETGFEVPTAWYNRACARSLLGDVDGALADLRTSAEAGMAFEGIAKDSDLDNLRQAPAFAELQERILAAASAKRELKTLVQSRDPSALPALAALVDDAQQPAKTRSWAALALADLQLAQGSHEEARATFERAASLGAEAGTAAFGIARTLAAAHEPEQALHHAELALDLGWADPVALGSLLDALALTTPERTAALVERAAQAAKEAEYGYGEKEKAWAGGAKKKAAAAKADPEKVARDS